LTRCLFLFRLPDRLRRLPPFSLRWAISSYFLSRSILVNRLLFFLFSPPPLTPFVKDPTPLLTPPSPPVLSEVSFHGSSSWGGRAFSYGTFFLLILPFFFFFSLINPLFFFFPLLFSGFFAFPSLLIFSFCALESPFFPSLLSQNLEAFPSLAGPRGNFSGQRFFFLSLFHYQSFPVILITFICQLIPPPLPSVSSSLLFPCQHLFFLVCSFWSFGP